MKIDLTFPQRQQLVTLLLSCPSLSRRDTREDLLHYLSQCTRQPYNGTRNSEALPDVTNLVNYLIDHEGYLETFIDLLGYHEQASQPYLEVVRYLQETVPGIQLTATSYNGRTRPDLRPHLNPHHPHYPLHQRYLRQLIERLGTLNLAQINPERSEGIFLEDVYVDSPTALALSIEFKDWQIVDWWLSRADRERPERAELKPKTGREETTTRLHPPAEGYEPAPFEILLKQEIGQSRPEDANEDWYYNEWDEGIYETVINLHLADLAAGHPRLVIKGAPGSGKSTFVRYLALCLAGEGLGRRERGSELNLTRLPNWTHGPLTPIYIELRQFVGSDCFPSRLTEQPEAAHLWSYIRQHLLPNDLQAYPETLHADLKSGQALLILDGLDEVPYPKTGWKSAVLS